MLQYVVRRLVYGAVTLLALSIIVFTLLQNTGGGPLDRLRQNPRIQAADIQRITEYYGLDQPAWKQYFTWAGKYVQFWDQRAWGESFQGDGFVRDIIADRVLATLRLMLTALGLAIIIGIPLGVFQALRQYSFFDQAGTTFSFVTFSTPIFVLAITLQLLLAVYLEKWTGVKFFFNAGMNHSSYGTFDFWGRIGDTLSHLFLPAISIALISIAGYSRYQRAAMLDVLHSDYLRTAKAKGLSRRRVIVKHALRNALIPIVTLVSLDVAGVLGGAVITESIFGWPGIGRKYIEAIGTNDYPVVMAVVMAIGIMVVIMNVVADLAYGFLDPRVRYD
ncbi:MAG: ABC transporter permease [Actinobacteria bacterium]|nr:ABC transporter permease [Actinomycetota bacterium]